MKNSKLHYAVDIVVFGIVIPFFAYFLLQEAIKYKWIVLTDTVLGDFIKEFTLEKWQNIIIVFTLFSIFFGSLTFCLYLGKQRTLIDTAKYNLLNKILITVAIATTFIILSVLAMSELQLSIFTGWISFLALILSLSKFFLNTNSDSIKNDNNDKQSRHHPIEK